MLHDLVCRQCSSPFQAKRRDAELCSNLCRNRARPPRKPPTSRQRRAWRRRRLKTPGYRERVNALANARIREVKAWIAAFKLERGCIDCGYRQHAAALDIDHVNGKTINLSSAKSIRAAREEIERHACEVRCANCHRIRTFETRAWEVPRT